MPRLHSPHYAAALKIAERLRTMGHQAYFAGGCVRDLLLGCEPKDFDVATSATPDLVEAAFPRTESVGAHFGVVLVIDSRRNDAGGETERIATEVATFRHDGAYTDGRRPDAVRYSTSADEDVQRRDFTINGLLLDPLKFEAGEPLEACVLDFVGGRADLDARVLRAIGDPTRRFAEDKLRTLRAVRFAARLGFTVAPATLAAIRSIASEVPTQVSPERVREELTKLLTEGHAHRGFELLDETGLLQVLLPEIARMKGCEQPPEFHPEGDVWVHTLMLLDHLESGATPPLAWGMLLHDVGKPPTYTSPDPCKPGDRIRFNGHAEVGVAIARSILQRLRFSNDDCEQILALVKHHMQFGDVKKMRESTLKRFLRLPRFEEHLALHFADVSSSHGMLGMYDFLRAKREQFGHEQIQPRPLLTGADLVRAGYKPGPRFRQMLTAAEDAQLEGAVGTPEAAMALVRAHFGEPL